jgi:hypothetical protein
VLEGGQQQSQPGVQRGLTSSIEASTHLFETDLGGSFTEALSADVHTVSSARFDVVESEGGAESDRVEYDVNYAIRSETKYGLSKGRGANAVVRSPSSRQHCKPMTYRMIPAE